MNTWQDYFILWYDDTTEANCHLAFENDIDVFVLLTGNIGSVVRRCVDKHWRKEHWEHTGKSQEIRNLVRKGYRQNLIKTLQEI